MSLQKLIDLNRDKPRRFEIVAKSATEADVFVYDTIGAFYGIDPGAFVKALAEVKADTIHLRINSPGGDVFGARAMMTAITAHPAKVIAHVDGLAASAASFLMLSADRIEISDGAFVMIHAPWAGIQGNADALREEADLLDKIGAAMASDYAKRAGVDLKTVAGWMDGETWFSASEALTAGLVDEIVDSVPAKAAWDLSAYQHAPEALVAAMATGQPEPTTEVQGSAPDKPPKEAIMADSTAVTGQIETPNVEAAQAAARQAERIRASEINRIGAAAKLPADAIQAAIKDGTNIEAFKDIVLNAMVAASNAVETRGGNAAATVARDETETRHTLMAAAIMARFNGQILGDSANDYRNMSCLRMAEESLTRLGINARGLTPNELAIKAMQQTSDFPLVLENSSRKLLMDAYTYATPTYRIWAKPSTTSDFKTMSRTRLGEAPAFLKVPEGAQITIGTMTESREQYAIATYGRGVCFTRQMLINDDLQAFKDLVQQFGFQAAILENKTAYAILTANANMSDSTALFHANHGNLGTGVIGNAGLDAMFIAMGTQKGLDGASILNLTPKYLIVPKAKETTATAALTAVGPNVKASDQNWFAGRLTVVADGELDASSTTVWYGACDPGMFPGVEFAHLNGATGPQILRSENEDGVLGLNLYAFLDFGAKAVDWRPLYKSSGA